MRPSARRWFIVLALFVVTYGISTPLPAYGVFLPVLAETFGWSRGAIAAAVSINLLLGGIAGVAVGALADRHGARVMLMVTVSLAGAAFALVLVGFNLGYISSGPLAAALVIAVGWRAAYALLGGGGGLITLLAALTVRLPRAAELTSRLCSIRFGGVRGAWRGWPMVSGFPCSGAVLDAVPALLMLWKCPI